MVFFSSLAVTMPSSSVFARDSNASPTSLISFCVAFTSPVVDSVAADGTQNAMRPEQCRDYDEALQARQH
jgi:hypothetical protein